ncbi:MAG: TadE family protein [Acidimicrobiia bacterium]|nr:TadE family protein [Acidimicrobiia bacterium]
MTERGSLTVEAAFVIPVLLLIGLAVFEGVATMSNQLQVMAATRDGVRVAATTPDVARAVATVRDVLPDDLAQTAKIEVHRPATAGRPARVRVSVEVPLRTPILSGFSIPLGWVSSMLVEP